MNTTAKAGSLWVIAVSAGIVITAPSCGDGDPTDVGSGGSGATGNRGGTSTGGRGGSTGGSAGSSGQGGTTGGSAGSSGQGGSAGSAGNAGRGGSAGMGGEGGEGGQGGEGGEGGEQSVVLYNFENGVQGWSTSTPGASVSQSPDQHVDGSNSLKITHGVIDASSSTGPSSVIAQVSGTEVWPGTVITFNAFLPAGFDTTGGTYFQAFLQGNNYLINFETAGNSSRTAVPGGLTTWTYTVPNTFPGGLQVLGFQMGDNSGGTTIAAGDVYIDSITATGGVRNCALATPAGLHDFETSPLDASVYQVDANNPAPRPTLSQATDRAFMGSGSMKVSFAGLPAGTETNPQKRIVYIDKPNVYCGQTITVHVFLPTGSDGMTFQVFAQYDNFGTFTGTGARTVTTNTWNTATYTIPTTVGPGGIQRVGLEFIYSGSAAFTGDAWVDAISW